MTITAKHIQRSNVIAAYADGVLRLPEAAQIFSLYSSEQAKGATFSDTPSMATRIFEFPVIGLQWVFEPTRIRLEDKMARSPKESRLAHEINRVLAVLYPDKRIVAYGFNYDMIYRMDTVISVKEIMGSFLDSAALEEVKDFGWQYTLARDKGKRAETYFFKAVSPIEYAVHANYHFNEAFLPKSEELQRSFERRYADADESLASISLT